MNFRAKQTDRPKWQHRHSEKPKCNTKTKTAQQQQQLQQNTNNVSVRVFNETVLCLFVAYACETEHYFIVAVDSLEFLYFILYDHHLFKRPRLNYSFH